MTDTPSLFPTTDDSLAAADLDALEAIAALASDDDVHEVEDPSPECLTNPIPAFGDPDDTDPIPVITESSVASAKSAASAKPRTPEITAPLEPLVIERALAALAQKDQAPAAAAGETAQDGPAPAAPATPAAPAGASAGSAVAEAAGSPAPAGRADEPAPSAQASVAFAPSAQASVAFAPSAQAPAAPAAQDGDPAPADSAAADPAADPDGDVTIMFGISAPEPKPAQPAADTDDSDDRPYPAAQEEEDALSELAEDMESLLASEEAGAYEEDRLELAAQAHEESSPAETVPFTPVQAAAVTTIPAADRISGTAKSTGMLAWGSRTDVGRVRDHNEDSFLIQFPLFVVADGMGGHAAGEVASTVAVTSICNSAVREPDPAVLAAAVERANAAVIEAAANGLGRPGMGTTCTAVYIEGNQMAVAHVGDSRCYLLHAGKMRRVTRDHSFVEELVAAGQITPEEARTHPKRSIITRALGSDPKMTADSMLVEVSRGDRVLLCSDGLNSMVRDEDIEDAMATTRTPQNCADALVKLALEAGGHDNVTCVVVDVKDDGSAARSLQDHPRVIGKALLAAFACLVLACAALFGIANHTWFLADRSGFVSLYHGIPGSMGPLQLSKLVEVTTIRSSSLSDAIEQRLKDGSIVCSDEAEARALIEDYRERFQPQSDNQQTTPDIQTATQAPDNGTVPGTDAQTPVSTADDDNETIVMTNGTEPVPPEGEGQAPEASGPQAPEPPAAPEVPQATEAPVAPEPAEAPAALETVVTPEQAQQQAQQAQQQAQQAQQAEQAQPEAPQPATPQPEILLPTLDGGA